jgi:hypothetical protein
MARNRVRLWVGSAKKCLSGSKREDFAVGFSITQLPGLKITQNLIVQTVLSTVSAPQAHSSGGQFSFPFRGPQA